MNLLSFSNKWGKNQKKKKHTATIKATTTRWLDEECVCIWTFTNWISLIFIVALVSMGMCVCVNV